MALPLGLAACKWNRGAVLTLTGATMGTSYTVIAQTDGSVDEAEVQAGIDAALAATNAQMSNWDSGSEISRFNAGAAQTEVALSPDLNTVMQAADAVHRASDGRFDTTVGPLIELWGFGAPGGLRQPEPGELAAAMDASGQGRSLVIEDGLMTKKTDAAQVYLSAIGKGYGADQVGRALEALGLTDYMVEIGGDLRTAGVNPDGQPWQIGVETPAALANGVFDVVPLSDMGLASSGDYRNYFEVDGQRFAHVIDPATGRPVTHTTASATVLAEDAMLADAWATAMMTLGSERGLEIAARENIAVLFLDSDSANATFVPKASARFSDLVA